MLPEKMKYSHLDATHDSSKGINVLVYDASVDATKGLFAT